MMTPSDEQMSFGDFDPDEGERRKKEGMDKAMRARRIQVWKQNADEWFHAESPGTEMTADMQRQVIGSPDVGANRNNVVGAWWSAKARRGEIEFTGRFAKSEAATRHGDWHRIWRKV